MTVQARPRDTAPAPADTPILEMRGISQVFPGVKALDGVSIALHPGQVTALIG
ncbi:MAG TPA: D-xylose ABC transporter ATP-binding protein, partial [Pararhizobium sp.]|nr:D-xylose ABC transporter ATP-binding protein [Pararhizobium sp.]